MSAAYVTVTCARGEIRKTGGNRNSIRSLFKQYCELTLEGFLKRHSHLTPQDFASMKVYYRRKNR